MKAIFISCFLLVTIGAGAQVLPGFPTPVVYFSFNYPQVPNRNAYYNEYNHSITADNGSTGYNGGTDRFGINNAALEFPIAGTGGFPSLNEHFTISPGHHFGANSGDNFTVACWVNIKDINRDIAGGGMRKIFYGADQTGKATFALMYKGHDILLRRFVNNNGVVDAFDYKFWAPAEFNTSGWYEIFLVVGKRSPDNMQYVKLYIGKPNYIAYDVLGPRVVGPTFSSLAWNFAGAYAFCSVKDGTNAAVEWGVGNTFELKALDGSTMAPPDMIDDFMVWNTALSENDAKRLFLCQSQSAGRNDRCWMANPITTRSMTTPANRVDSIAVRSGNKLEAFAKGKGTLEVNLTLGEPQGYNLYLYDINGRLITKKEYLAGFQGLNVQQLPVNGLPQGIYIVKAKGMELNLVQKVQIF